MKIYDIARLSGVSITTVSRVINKKTVKDEIKKRVIEVIERHSYQPDPYAQYLGRMGNGKQHP